MAEEKRQKENAKMEKKAAGREAVIAAK